MSRERKGYGDLAGCKPAVKRFDSSPRLLSVGFVIED
jgi:hypothetical protein